MKNALDDIECIPTMGNIDPPYQIISHPYCVDVISAYFSLSKLEFNDRENSLELIKESVEYYCLSNNINFNYHFDNKLPLIISPNTNNFQWFLGLQIISFDIYKINSLLSFQQKRYNEDEIDFSTFVEFAVYNIVKNFTKIENTERLKIIMDWVNNQRMLITNQNNPSAELPNKTIRLKKTNKSLAFDPSFQIIEFLKDPKYFDKNAPHVMEAFKLLKGGGFINQKTNYDSFKSILSGHKIKREARIDWTGKLKDLNRFVFLLTGQKIIMKIKYKWETTCNCFTNNDKDLSPEMIRKSNGKNDNEEKLKNIILCLKQKK